MKKPSYTKIDGEVYEINTDFRVGIECNKVAQDTSVGDYERALAIIYLLFGEKGLNATKIQDKLLNIGLKYLSLGKDKNALKSKIRRYELDINKCEGIIRSSFKFDYGFDPYEMEYLHWYDFYNDLENLSTSEFGNCCILNRIVDILEKDPKEIKDKKTRDNLAEAQKELKKKYCIIHEQELTKHQKESAAKFFSALGIDYPL